MVIERIKYVIGQVLDIDFKEHGDQIDIFNCEEWDSMNHMRLILEIERVFSISLSDDEVLDMTSFKGICKIIKGHLNND
jgi:acyl carrier protein